MTKLTRVEEEESDRDNPFRPGSELDREADSILRGSHVSRNSIQLSANQDGNAKPDSTLADSGVDGGDSLAVLQTSTGDQSVQLQPRRNSKGHVRIQEDTVYIVSPDTQVTTAVIADDDGDDNDSEHSEDKDFLGDKGTVRASSPVIVVNGHSSLLPTNSSKQSNSPPAAATTADMVEVQVCSATLNSAAPSIAEAVSVSDAKKAQRKLSAKQPKKSGGDVDGSGSAKKACCTVM